MSSVEMHDISDQTLRAFERYLLSDRNLKEALDLLPNEHGWDYQFLKIAHIMHTEGIKPFHTDKKLKDFFKDFADRFSYVP
jgi:hypothetical protein